MDVPANMDDIVIEAMGFAQRAGYEFLNKHFEGRDGGACGFGWVEIYDDEGNKIRKNSKLGKALAQRGIEKNWDGVHYVWNPGAMGCQSVDAKRAAADAYAAVFKQHGFKAYGCDRLD
jgi:hypothetical protein